MMSHFIVEINTFQYGRAFCCLEFGTVIFGFNLAKTPSFAEQKLDSGMSVGLGFDRSNLANAKFSWTKT